MTTRKGLLAIEKEEQRRIREQIREEEKAQKEIAKATGETLNMPILYFTQVLGWALAHRSEPALRESGMLPKGGIARFYGTAKLHKSGPTRDAVWAKVVQPEKDRDPEQKGWAVVIKVERAEDLDGQPLPA